MHGGAGAVIAAEEWAALRARTGPALLVDYAHAADGTRALAAGLGYRDAFSIAPADEWGPLITLLETGEFRLAPGFAKLRALAGELRRAHGAGPLIAVVLSARAVGGCALAYPGAMLALAGALRSAAKECDGAAVLAGDDDALAAVADLVEAG